MNNHQPKKLNKTTLFVIILMIVIIIYIICSIILTFLLPKDAKLSFDLIGKVPLCNRNSNSAPHIGNFVFLFCWRCTSMYISFIISMLVFNLTNLKKALSKIRIIYIIPIILIFILPLIIDGSLQYFFFIESTNLRRIITGILFGIGASIFTTRLINYLFAK